MSSDAGRAYPYRTPWQTIGCSVFMFGLLGAGGVALIPVGYEQLRGGRMPIGVAMMVAGVFAAPMVFMAVASVVGGIRNSVAPPLLRATASALVLPPDLRHAAPLHDRFDRAMHADEEHRQAAKPARAVRQDAERFRIGIVMPEFGNDVQAEIAVDSDGFVERGIEDGNEFLEVRPLAAGTKADPGAVAFRHDVAHIGIDAEIHPRTFELLLDGSCNGGFARSWCSVQDDDLPGMAV